MANKISFSEDDFQEPVDSGGLPSSTVEDVAPQTVSIAPVVQNYVAEAPAVVQEPSVSVSTNTDPLAHAYDNATYNVMNPAGWTPSASDLGTLPFDPAIFEGTTQSQFSTTGGGGLQGSQFTAGIDPNLATSVQSDPYYEVQKNLSELLKSNQFDKAVSYAQDNKVLDYLTTPSALKNLREPFTANEAASFLQAMSKVDPGADHKYNPETALSASLGQWDSSTGYPGYGGGVYRPNTTFDNVMDNLVTGALLATGTAAVAPFATAAVGSLGLSGSGLASTVVNQAAKSALTNTLLTAIQGGDLGDILKAAAQGAVTGGAGAAVSSVFVPALQEAMSAAGLDPSIAKAASTAAISAGQAAVSGQDPLQAAFISGMGEYAKLEGNNLIKDFANKSGISVEVAKQLVGPAGAALASTIVGGDAMRAALNQLVNQNYQKVLDYAQGKFVDTFPNAADKINDFKNEFKNLVQQGEDGLKGIFSGSSSTSTPSGLDEVTVTAGRLPDVPVNPIGTQTTSAGASSGALPSQPPPVTEEVQVTADSDQPAVVPVAVDTSSGGLSTEPPPAPPIEEVVVKSGGEEPSVVPAVISEPTGGLPAAEPPSAPPVEEVVVESGREEPPVAPVVISEPTGTSGGLAQTVQTPEQLETVDVTAQKLPQVPVPLTALEKPQEPTSPLDTVTEPAATTSPQEPLEEVEVTAQKQPEVPVVVSSGALPSAPQEPTSPLEQVEVTAKKEPEVPVNAISAGNFPTVGSDGMEEVAVIGHPYTPPPLSVVLNPFTPPAIDTTTPNIDTPFNLNIQTGSGSGQNALASGAMPESFWLDTSGQFLKGKPVTGQGAQLAQLQQIFSQLDPSLRGVLADRGYTPASIGGTIRAYADGGTTCCFKAVLKCMAPNFVPCNQETLSPLSAPRQRQEILKKLTQINPALMGGARGYAQGGLPSEYREAAPKGHNPEFITGLTGYYAQGGGTGQSDDIPAMLHDGDYVMDADTVAAFGDGSSKAGAEVLERFRRQVPHENGPQGKAVPAKIADGEYVFPAAFVTALGGGDNKRGAKMLDSMRERLRAQKRSAPTSKIPPKAKSPLDYLRK